jgi:hypothetical protein
MNNTPELKNIISEIKQPKVLLDEKFQKKVIKTIIEDDQFSKDEAERAAIREAAERAAKNSK